MIGRILDGRYNIIRVLSAGGFGHTYVAEDLRIPGLPTCVVKQLKPANTSTEFIATARRLFQTEAESLAKLGDHPQIPRLLAYFEEDQEFYLVQEYIEGLPISNPIISFVARVIKN
jgi:serine/threonine-protein kinase